VTSAILSRPGLVLVLAALLTLGLGGAASRIGFDNTPETWLPSGGAGLEDLETFRERFGDDSMILAFAAGADLDSAAWRQGFADLAEALRGVDGVESVQTPRRAVATGPEGAARPPQTPARLFDSPLEPYLIGSDGHHVALALFLTRGLDPQQRSRLVTRIEALLAQARGRVGPLQLAGADVITHDLDAGTASSLGRLSPLVLLTMCGIFYYATRSARAVGAMLLAALASGAWSLGLMALAGRTLNLVIVVMPAILAVITAAQATHLLSRYLGIHADASDAGDRATRLRWWRESIEATWRPCLLSAVTTAAGFAALGASEIPPIRDMGVFTAIGVVFSFALTFTLVPALLLLSPAVTPHPLEQRRWTPARAAGAGDFLRRHAIAVLVVATGAAGLCAIGLGRLELESHILRFFPSEHRVPRSYAEVEEKLLGLTPFELIVEGPRDEVLSGRTLAALDRYVEDALRTEPLLLQVLSPWVSGPSGTLPAEAQGGVAALPAETRASLLRSALPSSSEDLPASARRFLWISAGTLALRATLTSRTGTSNECHDLVERLRTALPVAFPPGITAKITGGPTLLIRGQVLLLETQVRSFALAFVVISLVIAIAFRSFRVLLVSLIPNLLPIIYTLGLMGLVHIPLDTATVTVAGIALGLIVDDTIHILHRYAAARSDGATAPTAIADTLYIVGRPVLVTSIAVAAGFGGFAFSPFPPTFYFGLLIAWTSISAVACDLLVLPALLLLGARGEAAR
jgi:predicted RND superfamily exporter protein